jgi:2-polyprenyl-3-methyl-5-hydroxy-6-metoxy-1,4-benzoquinol methylase
MTSPIVSTFWRTIAGKDVGDIPEVARAQQARADDGRVLVASGTLGLRLSPPPLKGRTTVNPNKALWEKGDFTRIAESMRESGEALVSTLGISEGLDVLDLGCGDGTTALPAAQLGANVLGVDIASTLVEAGNARAQSLGLSRTAGSRKATRPT